MNGAIHVGVALKEGRSALTSVAQRDGYQVRFPKGKPDAPPQAIIINTGGGIASGDHVRQSFNVETGAALSVATQAAERVYRRCGKAISRLEVHADIGPQARFAWLPQETIVFDDAALERDYTFNLAPDARAIIVECLILGRPAMGERVRRLHLRDRWRITRNGALSYADAFALDDAVLAHAYPSARLNTHGAFATLLYIAPDAEDRLDAVRHLLPPEPVATRESAVAAATAFDGKLIIRALAPTAARLRAITEAIVPRLTDRPVPRVWMT
ncbi:MAG: urease accessory protein UreD [Pseudomonadota bacterium]